MESNSTTFESVNVLIDSSDDSKNTTELNSLIGDTFNKYCKVDKEDLFLESNVSAIVKKNPMRLNMILLDIHEKYGVEANYKLDNVSEKFITIADIVDYFKNIIDTGEVL